MNEVYFVITMIIFITTIVLMGCYFHCIIETVKNRSAESNNNLLYKFLKPQLQEYATLKGYTSFGRSIRRSNTIQFYNKNPYIAEELKLDEVEDKLTELKKVLEKNCPKKCEKKRRGRM